MRFAIVCALAALVSFGGAARSQPADPLHFSWLRILEGCLDYFRTGRRSVFADWDVAYPGGGVCNGDPSCEGPVMTFIPTGRAARAAATLHVPGGVGDRPTAGTCAPAIGVRDTGNGIFETLADRLADEVAQGALIRRGTTPEGDPVYAGGAHDGRAMRLILRRRLVSSNRFTLAFPAADGSGCARLTS